MMDGVSEQGRKEERKKGRKDERKSLTRQIPFLRPLLSASENHMSNASTPLFVITTIAMEGKRRAKRVIRCDSLGENGLTREKRSMRRNEEMEKWKGAQAYCPNESFGSRGIVWEASPLTKKCNDTERKKEKEKNLVCDVMGFKRRHRFSDPWRIAM
jgi:hypothetical protein